MLLLCAICTELMKEDDHICATTCGHIYHHQCLVPWVRSSQNCPQCREPVSDGSMFRVFPTSGASAGGAVASGVSGAGHDTATLEEDNEAQNASIESMDQLLASVQEELSVRNNDIVLLQAQLQSMEETHLRENMTLIEALRRNAKVSENKLEIAKQNITNLEQQLDRSKTESMELKKKNIDLANKLKQAERTASIVNVKLVNMKQSLEQQINTSKMESMQVKYENLNLADRLKGTEMSLSSAKNELESSRRTIIDLEQHLDGSKNEINKLRKRNRHLSQRLQGFARAVQVTAANRQVDMRFIIYDHQEKLALKIVERLARVLASLRAELIADNNDVVIRLDRALLKPMEKNRMLTEEWKSYWDWLRTPYEAISCNTRSSCRCTPEAVPTASDVIATAPEAKPSAPDPVPTAPKAVPTAPEAAPTSPDAMPTTPDAIPTAPDAMPTAAEAVPTASEAAPTASDAIATAPGAIPTATEAVSSRSEAVLRTSEATPIAPEVVPTSSEVVLTVSEAVLTSSEVVLTSSEAVPTSSEVVLTSSEAVLTSSEAVPTSSEVALTASEAVPTSSEVALTASEAVPTSSEVVLTASEAVQIASDAVTTALSVPTPRPRSIHVKRENSTTAVETTHVAVPTTSILVPGRPTEVTVRPAELPNSPVPTPRPRSIHVKRKNDHNTAMVDTDEAVPRFTTLDMPNDTLANFNEIAVPPAISTEKAPASVEVHIRAEKTSPQAMPTAPEAVPTAPEATPSTSKAVPTAPEAMPTAQEAVPTAPEATPSAPKAVPTAPEAMPTAPEAVPTASEATPTTPETVLTVPS